MAGRALIIALALGMALAGSRPGEAQLEQRQAEEEDQNGGDQPPPRALPVRIIVPADEQEDAERREQIAYDLQVEDVRAAQSIEAATQRMTEIAFWQNILVLIGTVALIYTLYLTRRANNAAREAVDVTREIGRGQLRAYVLTQNLRAEITGPDYHGSPVTLALNGEFLNAGQTPAFDVRAHWDGGTYDADFTPEIPPLRDPARHSSVTPPGGEFTFGREFRFDSIDDLKRLHDAKQIAAIYGRIEFTDAFGERFRHDFKYDIPIAALYDDRDNGIRAGMKPDGRVFSLISIGREQPGGER